MTAVARYTNLIYKMFLMCIKLKMVINWLNLMKKKFRSEDMKMEPHENQNTHKKKEASRLSGQQMTRTLTHFQKYYDLFHWTSKAKVMFGFVFEWIVAITFIKVN